MFDRDFEVDGLAILGFQCVIKELGAMKLKSKRRVWALKKVDVIIAFVIHKWFRDSL